MIKLDKVSKVFGTGVAGLSEINLGVEKGEFVFLVGPTGSGKTTLFRLLTRETLPSKGTILVGEWDVVKLPAQKIPHLRKKIGVIFQDLKLLMDRTIFENIVLPLDVVGVKKEEAEKRVSELLEQMSITMHRNKFPIQLSGGELQRVAIARALVLGPDVLLADEPTGNLDPKTSQEIMKLLIDINAKGTTVLMATHNHEIVNKAGKRVVSLEKGKLVKDEKKGKYGSS
ncbi:MAG: cell division ATP-binding protein FtsE [Patescibacteria group bacterium]